MSRSSVTAFIGQLRWRTFGHEGQIAVAAVLLIGAVLIAVWPQWTLDYLRVLAWPLVVLTGLLLFRWPITAILNDAAIEEGRVGPLNLQFRSRQSNENLSTVIEAHEAERDQ